MKWKRHKLTMVSVLVRTRHKVTVVSVSGSLSGSGSFLSGSVFFSVFSLALGSFSLSWVSWWMKKRRHKVTMKAKMVGRHKLMTVLMMRRGVVFVLVVGTRHKVTVSNERSVGVGVCMVVRVSGREEVWPGSGITIIK
jgi:hypothetical protein